MECKQFLSFPSKYAGNFSLYERLVAKYGGAAAMYFVAKKLKERHNITDERAALYGAAEQWVGALEGRKFHGMFKFNQHIYDIRSVWYLCYR